MSWYSDGEPFDEFDPPECRDCEKNVTAEGCRKCWEIMKKIDERDEEQEEE